MRGRSGSGVSCVALVFGIEFGFGVLQIVGQTVAVDLWGANKFTPVPSVAVSSRVTTPTISRKRALYKLEY